MAKRQGDDVGEYEINIDPKILEFLGPKLYTNVYFVLAELIANSYDANAHNVYVIKKPDRYIVEDDGNGMSRVKRDIAKYLDVAQETRVTKDDVYVEGSNGKRKRIGRKGIGKLAALAVSDRVLVQTVKNREVSGFILSRKVNPDRKLVALTPDEIRFEKYRNPKHGTSIVMLSPEYELSNDAQTVANNLVRLFPVVNKNFQIHIETPTSKAAIKEFDKNIIRELGALITLGEDFAHLSKYFDPKLKNSHEKHRLLDKRDSYRETLVLKTREGITKDYTLEVKGWIGAYQTTRNRKRDRGDFEDNFISLYSNGKMGEFNILTTVGNNTVNEVYVVGQLHVDLFEETELPDMALSNRQGYKTDDERYKAVINHVRGRLLRDIVALRVLWAKVKKEEQGSEKLGRKKELEERLRAEVEDFQRKVAESISKKVAGSDFDQSQAKDMVSKELNQAVKLMSLKSRVDSHKKKIMICHKSDDKEFSDLIYNTLLFNGVPKEDILYTSSDNFESRVPDNVSVLEYLRDFFVDSISNEKIFVVYVTSDAMAASWYPVTEVGAGWITECAHKIFNLKNHSPSKPLDTDKEYQSSTLKANGDIVMSRKELDKFVISILSICKRLKYAPRSHAENSLRLSKLVQTTKS